MDALNRFLADLPVASLTFLASVVGGLIALSNGSIDFTEFQIGLGATGVGTGILGAARVQAAKTDVTKKSE
jgi:hypothetical protein